MLKGGCSRALKARMLTPALVEEFIRTFAEELAALQRESTSRRTQLENGLVGDRAAPSRRATGDRGWRLERRLAQAAE